MKKIIAVACLSLAALGFSTTSALAANDLTHVKSQSASFEQIKQEAIKINMYLYNVDEISSAQWHSNIFDICLETNEQKLRAIHAALVNQKAVFWSSNS